jgi:protein SOK2
LQQAAAPHAPPYRGESQDSASTSAASSTASNAASSVTGYTTYSHPSSENKGSPSSSADGTGGEQNHSALAPTRQPDYLAAGEGYPQSSPALGSMQTQSYMDVHSSHLASTQPYTSSQPGTTDNIQQHYPHYPQPPVLHPGPSSYGPTTTSYSPYGYPNGVSSPQTTSQPVTTGLAPPITSHILPLPPGM